MKKSYLFLAIALIATLVLGACAQPGTPQEPADEGIVINLWTKEGETDGGLQYVQALADAYTAQNGSVAYFV